MCVWRRSSKFPEYEVSSTWLVRHRRTKRIIPQRNVFDKMAGTYRAMVMLSRNSWNTETHVSEMVYKEFPEQRMEVKRVA